MLTSFRPFHRTQLIVVACCAMTIAFVTPPKARAQSTVTVQTSPLAFDVASVRQNTTGPGGDEQRSNVPLGPGNVYSPTAGVFSAHNFPLQTYILFAYRMTDGQWRAFRAQLPEWALSERFNIEARTDKQDVTKDELRRMMQALLEDRFKFAIHTELRPTSVYGLVLAMPGTLGPKLRPHPAGEGCSKEIPKPVPQGEKAPSETMDGGYPTVCGGILRMDQGGSGDIILGGRDIPLRMLADATAGWGQLERPVVDQTGLTGNFDFVLDYKYLLAPDAAETAEEGSGAPFQKAMKQQLGLRLQPQKLSIDFLVLDHIEHPTEN